MFFLYSLERQVTLHPSYFGRNMHELVTSKLLRDVEGTCTGTYYIVTIMDTFTISEGRILPGSGLAEFTVGYRAVVWRPFKGETVRDHFQGLFGLGAHQPTGRLHCHLGQRGWLFRRRRSTSSVRFQPCKLCILWKS
jgi:hypothetical protein